MTNPIVSAQPRQDCRSHLAHMVQNEDQGNATNATFEATKQPTFPPPQFHHQDIDSTRLALSRVVQALGATLLLAAIPQQFAVPPGQPCSKFPVCTSIRFSEGRFYASLDDAKHISAQICDPRTLQPPIYLPLAFHRFYTCETLLLVLALSTFVHWLCVFDIFQQPRWSDRYLSATVYTTMVCLIPAAFLVVDPVTIVAQILPAITDVCLVFCVLLDILRVEGSTSKRDTLA
ncbi:hypothetical protein EDB80DRAFT_730161 [Ilyonectria destructans]|nr:hypothetical protein EDB80DRAFT_730161 [Ilyonectria destructans]